MKLSELENVMQARVLAWNAVQNGLADPVEIRSDLESWNSVASETGFDNYLIDTQRLAPAEVEALRSLTEARLQRQPEWLPEIAATWGDEGAETHAIAAKTPARRDARPTPSSTTAVSREADPATSLSSSRFEVVAPHRKGGLGEVYIAEDKDFRRRVALKRIKRRFIRKPELCARFLVEAELTGGLEHPGIVPVYGLGKTEDGSPFYAMKFVQGESLGEALRAFHARPDKSFQSLEFVKLLRRFVSVCYTIHFSHTRGVLHRDIKPDNIMLGEFDETLVVDWGIAKVIGRKKLKADDEAAATTTLYPASINQSDGTLLGKIIGTPGFMSSEQALGWHDSLGPESDVFSLGATLYFMLTHQIPFDGPSAEEILQNTISGTMPDARQLDRSIPAGLAAIAHKAMSHSKSARYVTALAMAEDIERFLADEAVTARDESIATRSFRWLRKHRAVAATAGAGVAVLAIGATLASVLLASAGQREAEARRQAAGNFQLANEAVDGFLMDLASDQRLYDAGLNGLVSELLAKAETLYVALERQDGGDRNFNLQRADTAHRISEVSTRLGRYQEADSYLSKAADLIEQNVATTGTLSIEDTARRAGILRDRSSVQSQLGNYTQSLELANEGLDWLDSVSGPDSRTPEIWKQRFWLLLRKDLALGNLGSDDERKIVRPMIWEAGNAYLEEKEHTNAVERLRIQQSLLELVPINDQERVAFRERMAPMLDGFFENMAGQEPERLSDRELKARSLRSVAVAGKATGQLGLAWKAGQAAMREWTWLADRFPEDRSYQKQLLIAVYDAFLARNNQEAASVVAGKLGIEPLDANLIREIMDTSRQAYGQLQELEATDAETDMVYAHLTSLLGGYLFRTNMAPDEARDLIELSCETEANREYRDTDNSRTIRSEVYENAAAYYLAAGMHDRGLDLMDQQIDFLTEQLDIRPGYLPLINARVDLHLAKAVHLVNVMSEVDEALMVLDDALSELDSVDNAFRTEHAEADLTLRTRLHTLAAKVHLQTGNRPAAIERFREGLNELDAREETVQQPQTTVALIEFIRIAVLTLLDDGQYADARRGCTFLLDKVPVSESVRVKFLADRAKCHAHLGEPERADEDFNAANAMAGNKADDIHLDLVIAALATANTLEATEDEAAQERVDELDDYAAALLKQKIDRGLFEFEIARQMIRDAEELQRLSGRDNWDEFLQELQRPGTSHVTGQSELQKKE